MGELQQQEGEVRQAMETSGSDKIKVLHLPQTCTHMTAAAIAVFTRLSVADALHSHVGAGVSERQGCVNDMGLCT